MGLQLYILAPIIGYLAAGSLKFALNFLRFKGGAFKEIGLGGIPSTHNTIAGSCLFTVGFADGWTATTTTVALGFATIVAIDSMDLRNRFGETVKALKDACPDNEAVQALRSKLGHRPIEVAAGYLLGLLIGLGLNFVV